MQQLHLHPLPPHPAGAPRRRRSELAWESANRLGLLLVHAMIGLFAGLLILFNGSAAAFDHVGAWSRPVTGVLALVGGLLLAAGLAHRPRWVLLEVAGLVVLASWDLAMTSGFVWSALAAGTVGVTWPWQALAAAPTVRLYPIALYLGMFAMMAVHLVTVLQLRPRAGRLTRLG